MDADRLDELLRYCHLEEFAEDTGVVATLNVLYSAALEYMTDAGVVRTEGVNTARYDLAVDSLVLQWYEAARENTDGTNGQDRSEPPGFRRLMNQLKR